MLISAMLAMGHNIMKAGNVVNQTQPNRVQPYRLWLCGAMIAPFSLAIACTPQQNIGSYNALANGGYCEAKFGTFISQKTPYVTDAMSGAEDVPGAIWKASLCKGAVSAELSVDSKGALEFIQFASPGQCLKDKCIGDPFSKVVADRAQWKIFVTAEEGGILSARRDENVTFSFDTTNIPIKCFENHNACPREIASARVNGIILRRP